MAESFDPRPLVKLSASSAHRWMRCVGSAFFAAKLRGTSSVYAARGTGAASILEQAVKTGRPPSLSLGQTVEVEGFSITFEQDDIDAIQTALSEAEWLRDVEGMAIDCEQFTSVELYGGLRLPGRYDICARNSDVIEIIDYKHGVGVPVSAVGNYQMLPYLADAIEKLGVRPEYRLTIIQPRAKRGQPRSSWTLTHAEFLERWRAVIEQSKHIYGAARAFAKHGRFVALHDFKAGEHCRWCPGLKVCPSHALNAASVLVARGADAVDKEVLTDAWAPNLDALREFTKEVYDLSLAKLMRGAAIDGVKLTKTKGKRQWVKGLSDEQMTTLRSLGLVTDKSVPQFEGVAKAAKVLGDSAPDYIRESNGTYTMVAASSPGEEVQPVTMAFEKQPNGEEVNG